MRTKPASPPVEIKLDKPYITCGDFSEIEQKIAQSLLESSRLIIDFTGVSDGVQGEFYGALLGKVQQFYELETDALGYLRDNLLLRFKSRSSKAYEKLTQGYDLFFKTAFLNE
ncbi:hypothetical protein KY346_05755 [Candidatus Woesearchaeota archaeon]|nr:hypothetical protein [Candidatus Woesearchaeota archaeon]